MNEAKEFEKGAKLDDLTKQSYSKELGEKFKKKPTKLGIFKSKNDLAIKLDEQFLKSKENQILKENLDWLVSKKSGVSRFSEILNEYSNAFDRIDEKYTKGNIDESFKAHFSGLKKMIPSTINSEDVREFKNKNLHHQYGNLKKSYYDILDKTTLPVIQKTIGNQDINLCNLTARGTDHPLFEKAHNTDKALDLEIIIEKGH